MSAQLALTFTAPDRARLGKQLIKVRDVMGDGTWRTLGEIEALTGAPQPSASARLRDLRAMGFTVQRRRTAPGSGLWEYRVAP